MISAPLKQTGEIDWISPLKSYIRSTYGDDPERYTEECATLNRLRQDMRGAGTDSASGRDLLYRYYGQLELLDLRFPVDEAHVKVSFTWFDAFTHKPTSQYSLAFEKASIIFNISAVLSCHAANQNRHEESGLKTAYHSFQASAGMFNYINDNFLHAPSTDLSRDTVKTLIAVMLAQGQEVFLEKQIEDGKKVGLLAKLASQAASLYTQAVEGVADNVNRQIFEKVWLQVVQIKASYMTSLAQFYQACTDDDTNQHGIAIARLQAAEVTGNDAIKAANSFPSSVPPTSNLSNETGSILREMIKRHITNVRDKLTSTVKDNDFIYHQLVPAEASLSAVQKMAAAKAIPVSELYQGQDIQRIIGPDIFQKIVPMAVTESASLYDEEKAKVVRAEAEKVEQANDEMAASLDYLKLPGSLDVLRGGMDQQVTVDDDFRGWCEELAGHEPFSKAFDHLQADKARILSTLETCTKQLDMEENICEKMRVKYGPEWTQQPSSRLNSTLRSDIRSYRGAVDEAVGSDSQLLGTARQYESDFDEMRSAGETDEADVLYQRAMMKNEPKGKSKGGVSSGVEGNLLDDDYGEGGPTVADQISRVEDILKKLDLIKKDRQQVFKDLKDRVHNDDISNVLILNKKTLPSHESQLFQAELEKFRPHQTRLLQSTHKQTMLLKDLTRAYGDLLQDPRVRSEQQKFDTFQRQRGTVLQKYRKIYQAFNDLIQGLMRAQAFYGEMRETADNLRKNVETFVSNRREEGGQQLATIERSKTSSAAGQANREQDTLRDLMGRMSVSDSQGSNGRGSGTPVGQSRPAQQSHRTNSTTSYSFASATPTSPPYSTKSTPHSSAFQPTYLSHSPAPVPVPSPYPYSQHQTPQPGYPPNSQPPSMPQYHQQSAYNPMGYPYEQHQQQQPMQHGYQQQPQQQGPKSPPAAAMYQQYAQQLPQGYVPPPPPPGPPPSGQQYGYGAPQQQQQQQRPPGQSQQRQGQDPWAGLGNWR